METCLSSELVKDQADGKGNKITSGEDKYFCNPTI